MTESNILKSNAKTPEQFAAMFDEGGLAADPATDLWNLVGKHLSGGLPDKTAPDFQARDTSGDIATSGLLTLINLALFIPAKMLLGALRDQVTGSVVGWELRPYAGNELDVDQVRQARAAAELRWPGIEQWLVARLELAEKFEIVERTYVVADPEAGPTLEEMRRIKGEPVKEIGETVKTAIDGQGQPWVFEERPGEDGEVLHCIGCKVIPIVGDLSLFEAVEGGFLCHGCHQGQLIEQREADLAEYRENLRKANE